MAETSPGTLLRKVLLVEGNVALALLHERPRRNRVSAGNVLLGDEAGRKLERHGDASARGHRRPTASHTRGTFCPLQPIW